MSEWHELVECLRNWTMKTSIGEQEAYNNLWEEIDLEVKISERPKIAFPEIYKVFRDAEE